MDLKSRVRTRLVAICAFTILVGIVVAPAAHAVVPTTPDVTAGAGRPQRNAPGIHQMLVDQRALAEPQPVRHQDGLAVHVALRRGDLQQRAAGEPGQRQTYQEISIPFHAVECECRR